MRKAATIAAVTAVLVILIGRTAYVVLEDRYQAEMDPRRVADVHHIAELVEQYRATVGSFPLSQHGYLLPVSVDLIPGGPPADWNSANSARPGTVVPVEDFVAELRAALGPDIRIPRDPQRAASGRPNWYQYAYDGRAAYIAASLASERPGTRKIALNYFKYEIALPRSQNVGSP